jgi:hypothetical protein
LLIIRQAENLANKFGLVRVQCHLAQVRGRDPLLRQAHFFGIGFPSDAFRDFGADDFFGNFQTIHIDSSILSWVEK